MATNEHRTRTESRTMNCEGAQTLSVRYAELLRLRQEVREAETRLGPLRSIMRLTSPVENLNRVRKNRMV